MVRYIRAANDLLSVDHDGGPGKGEFINDVFWNYEEDEDAFGVTYTIPYCIRAIHSTAFCECETLKRVIMPDTVDRIDNSAFQMCTNLETVVFSKNLTNMGEFVFSGCKNLKHVELPDSLSAIGRYDFYGCVSLRTITIPRSVSKILPSAFNKCTNLRSIEFESLNTKLLPHAFKNCVSIRTIKFPDLTLDVSYTDGVCSFTGAIQKCMYIIRDRNYKLVLSLLMDGIPFALDLIFELAKKDAVAERFIQENKDKLLEYASEYNRTDIKSRLLDMVQDDFNKGGSMRL